MTEGPYTTLLVAIGLSCAGLSLTLLGSWFARRSERFILTWAVGAMVLMVTVGLYTLYAEFSHPLVGLAAFSMLMVSFSILYGAARQIRLGESPVRPAAISLAFSLLIIVPPYLLGLDGLGAIVGNSMGGAILTIIGFEYCRGRAEAPVPMIGLALLYWLVAASFFLCSAVLLSNGQWVLSAAPQNWAEDLNLYVSVAGVTGTGALSLALDQTRVARRHHLEAMTDQLTGLLNRRALFDRFAHAPLAGSAVVLVDLDHFKSINDTHGHEAGDLVLREFAALVRNLVRPEDSAARIGGEEFVLLLAASDEQRARDVAERLRAAFAARMVELAGISLRATVSIGVALVDERGFEVALSEADAALYRAKDLGRDRVELATPLLAA
jgi:diguanylate cyclase (GGDEF)-like protein